MTQPTSVMYQPGFPNVSVTLHSPGFVGRHRHGCTVSLRCVSNETSDKMRQILNPPLLLIDTWVTNETLRALLSQLGVPFLRIIVIVFAALVLRRVVRRVINEAVERAKQPPPELSLPLLTSRTDEYVTGETDDDKRAGETARREQRANSLGGLARSVANVAIIATAVIMVLSEIGVELAPLIAGAGIVGLAVGFGAQDLVKDFLSGVFMLLEDQFGVGDIIEVAGNIGVVESISLRSTRLRSVDGTLWHVPNGDIRQVGNRSQEWTRALFDVEVSYDTDVDAALRIIDAVTRDIAADDAFAELFLEQPEVVGVMSLGADGVTLRSMAKVIPGQQWAIGREFARRIKRAFDAAGVEFPFPQRTVWLRTEKPLAVGGADQDVWNTPVPDKHTRDQAREIAPVDHTEAEEPSDDTPS